MKRFTSYLNHIFKLYISLMIVMIPPMVSANEITSLTIAKPAPNYPPYHWQENGETYGLIPEIINAVAQKLAIKNVTYRAVPWNRMIEMGQTGEVDAILPLIITQEREDEFYFSNEPLIYESMSFIKKAKTQIDYNGDFKQLEIYPVGIVAGYQYGPNFKQGHFTTVVVANEEAQLRMLYADRFPLTIMDTNVVKYYQEKLIKKYPLEISILTPEISNLGLHIAFSKKKNLKEFAKNFSIALNELKASGEYNEILQKYSQK